MTDLDQHEAIQVFVGIDVGKGAHHAVVLDRRGKRLLDCALPNDEAKLLPLIGKLKAQGPVLLVADQPTTVDALPVTVARDEDALVAYLPELAMRASQICTSVKPRPMRAMPTSLPRLLAACRVLRAR